MSAHLENGIQALKSGDKETARRHLAQALRESPNSERAWQWMFNAANNDTERIKCLREILRINPHNDKAQATLDNLQGNTYSRPASAAPNEKKERPWYRETAMYVVLFFLFFPALLILVVTDSEERRWTKIVSWIMLGLLFINVCVFGALTVLGPFIEDTFNYINDDISESSIQAPEKNPSLAQPNAQPEETESDFDVRPPGSPLETPGITIVVEKIEIRDSIRASGEVFYPQNGRFAVLQMAVTNTGTSLLSYSPEYHLGILDGKSAYMSIFGYSFAVYVEEDIYPPALLELPPGQTDRIIAVYDISSSAQAYALANEDTPYLVELYIP